MWEAEHKDAGTRKIPICIGVAKSEPVSVSKESGCKKYGRKEARATYRQE